MNDDPRRDLAPGEALRARTLRLCLPALVHRLNNALAVAQCVHDLGSEASAEEREHASQALLALRDSLERLAVLARPSAAARATAAPSLGRTHALLTGSLASSQQVELVVREDAPLERADAPLEGLLFDLAVALLSGPESARDAGPVRRLRLAARAHEGVLCVSLAALGLAPGADAREALALIEAHARARGGRLASRRGRRTFGLRLTLPAAGAPAARAHPARRSPRRVLLLHAAGLEREELAAFLREQGLVVAESDREPESGAFELALVEQRLAQLDSGLPARLRQRFGAPRIELLAPRTNPASLLQLVLRV